jgi:hypothetical protein
MAYSDLAVEDQILLAADFVGRGLSIPQEIRDTLGPDLTADIEHPETTNDRTQERVRSRHRAGRT